MTPLERLAADPAVTRVDPDGALAFARETAPGVLLLPGDPSRPEVTDAAVVVGELLATHGKLRFAVAGTGEEAAQRERFGVTSFPAVLFVKGGAVVKVLSRMQAWSAYDGAARDLEVST